MGGILELISRRMGEDPSAAWHAVRTRAGAEDKAFVGIEKAGMEAYLPTELLRVTYRGAGRCEMQWRPLFVGHIFAMLNPARDLPRLREIQGVDAEVRRGGRLVPVPEATIKALKHAERNAMFDLASGCRPREVGGAVSGLN